MHIFPKLLVTNFGIVGGILTIEESKKCNRAIFLELYVDDIPPGCVRGETHQISFPPITLGILFLLLMLESLLPDTL